MKKILIFLFIIINLYNCEEIKYNHSKNENNLYFVLTSFRHGARKTFVKKDVFKNEIKDKSQLTSYGEKQHLIIGEKYRERYYNFLNLKTNTFDNSQIYVISSKSLRTKISTIKQLEGLFDSRAINQKYINYVNVHGGKSLKVYDLNNTEIQIMNELFNSCHRRKLANTPNYHKIFKETILPIFEKCYGKLNKEDHRKFCDNTISAFFEYHYNNKKDNKIGKCGFKTAKIFYDYCINRYDSMRSWNEKSAYFFYNFFKYVFKYMKNVIDGKSKIKMIMIGGHDSTVAPLMNFFHGMNIIKRTEYPHYAFNIVFELRKYNNQFYLEIYYNDILKYNQTLDKFKSILDSSKYSNINNYCKKTVNVENDINIKKENIKILKNNNYNNNYKLYICISCLYIIWFIYLFNLKLRKRRIINFKQKDIPKNMIIK